MRFRNMLVILVLSLLTPCFAASTSPANHPANWYDDFIFKSPDFTFQLIRTLGYAYEKGADLGESISTAKMITDGDFNSWYQAWSATANRIEDFANNSQTNGYVISARNAYLRASNYYRTAGFYMVAPADRHKSITRYAQSKDSFLKAIASLPYVQAVKIPYEKTTLPGYLVRTNKPNAPLVIVNTGFDGTAEELFFEVGSALHERGYNCLLVEGPGQGSVLRKQNLPFRPDWEKVVTPIVDFAETLPNINKQKIALMGISMGGYLAPRAAAFEPRIKALIANGGIYDYGAAVYNALPAALIELIDKDPKAFNEAIKKDMTKNATSRWFFENGMWSFHASTPAEFMKLTKDYTLKDVVKNIQMPTLVVNSEEDTFLNAQAVALFKHLSGPKTYLLFTRKEAAQSHCQMGATSISNERIFDWLDKILK